ncbi:MAG TPA: HK97 gp10 family phage protein [Pseudomonas xinjiangensis]|uniref:HK97 gp10 family phage protein n=2 Tax=root TaxID=1 RepID=A0A7V1BMR2_9GAMM|nr:HK97 gp10 family phage protein [Halopseudomonas xinjiangensis]HEC47155.1 HK97 gp10 family phage protein [Halopseudomonas xinjiangensis]
MADGIEFAIGGLDSLLGKLEAISYETKRKGGRAALRKAAQVVEAKAKQNAAALDDKATGRSISANIGMRWNGRLFKRTGDPSFRVGVQHGAVIEEKGNPDPGLNGPTPHWRLIELGREGVSPNPFMRSALESSIDEATNTFVTEYEKAIDRAIKSAAKKGQRA